MKKIYALTVINQTTGEIEHVVTSDLPITDAIAPVSEDVIGIPTIPPTVVNRYIQHFDYEVDDAEPFENNRARDVLESLEIKGVTPAARRLPNDGIGFKRQPTDRAKPTGVVRIRTRQNIANNNNV